MSGDRGQSVPSRSVTSGRRGRNSGSSSNQEREKEQKEPKLNPKMSKALSTCANRIQKELAEITLNPPPNCSAGPKEDNLYEWVSTILALCMEEVCSSWTFTFHQNILSSLRRFYLVGSIANQYLQHRAEHDRIARLWRKCYAT